MSTEFDDIRPYNDAEVPAVVARLCNDSELHGALAGWKLTGLNRCCAPLARFLVKQALRKQLAKVNTVNDFQSIVKSYMDEMMGKSTSNLSYSGLDKLDRNKAYLFVSNHRDIAMDPAFVNWALYTENFETLRIAIGDNLLTKPFASDLMRVNKSFIVNRSAQKPREKLKAAKHLSNYIRHSVVEDKANVWIAQREGRAKDGLDITNSAVIGMFGLSKAKPVSLTEHIADLHIVPVSISYELDPCDIAKACELEELARTGSYEKGEQEDIASIAAGIAGQKAHVHVAFGEVLAGDYENNDDVVAELDRTIVANYRLAPTNYAAFELLQGQPAAGADCFTEGQIAQAASLLAARFSALTAAQRDLALAIYANPVRAKLAL